MYESQGCQWCEAWDEEVGIIYAKTEEGKVLPLRRIDADSDMPEDLAEINGLVYTPTFVAWDRGQEIGRIIGYPGESFFWAQLNELVGRLERGQSAGN
ncbi:MAG: thioredoxin family protein [Rhodospirillaceae bacterium]|nr:thioredoxin family protein [Rhodospirillaceae bacterium]